MQTQLIAGDSLNETTVVQDYAPADGWLLKYRLIPMAVGGTPIDLATDAVNGAFVLQVPASTTAAWVAGEYSWVSWVDKAGEIYTVAQGQLSVLPDPRQALGGYDVRSQAQKALASCEAAMATFNATGGKVKKYEIAGRTMEFQTIGDLMQLHSFWKLKVQSEQSASQVAQGLGNPRNLFVRWVRP